MTKEKWQNLTDYEREEYIEKYKEEEERKREREKFKGNKRYVCMEGSCDL